MSTGTTLTRVSLTDKLGEVTLVTSGYSNWKKAL